MSEQKDSVNGGEFETMIGKKIFETALEDVKDLGGDTTGMAMLLARERLRAVTAEMKSRTDTLLPILNKRGLAELFGEIVENAKSFKKELEAFDVSSVSNKEKTGIKRWAGFQGYSILIIDLVGLHKTNDDEGRAAGNQALKDIQESAHKAFARGPDVVARIGGDEFAAVLINSDRGELQNEVDRFLEKLPEGRDVYVVANNFDPKDNFSDSLDSVLEVLEENKRNMPQEGKDETGRLLKGDVLIIEENG